MKRKSRTAGAGSDIPPLQGHVEIYFLQKGFTVSYAQAFYQYYNQRDWLNNSHKPIADWKRMAFYWRMRTPIDRGKHLP